MAGALGSSSASAAALDALEETFNSLLLQMGSVFHKLPDTGQGPRPDNRHLTKCNAHMKQFVPQALSQFQDNLDSLESELVRAQQTIRRDLLLSRIKPEPTRETSPVAAAAAAAAETVPAAAPSTTQNDTDMKEAASAGLKEEEEAAKEDGQDEKAKAKALKQDEVPPSATSDDGLDAMFNDLTNPDPAPAEDEANGDQSNSTNEAKQAAESQNNASTNENNDDADVSSLLPGLETYANDNAMPDFPSGDFGADLGDGGGFGSGDFNFEDMIQGFGGSSGGGGGGDGMTNGDAAMTDFTQFDEDFFNI